MKKIRPIYYDTETTGIRTDKDRIVEIAAYDPARDQSFVRFVNPGIPIPQEATNIHNITDAMVKDAASFETVAKEFITFCEGNVVLIAHNNDAFDQPMLLSEFKRHDVSLPKWPYIDSLKFARKYRPDLPKHSLQHLREYHRIPANQAHRALDDVIILYKVFSELIDDLSMESILELLSESKTIRTMPFGKYRGRPLQDVPASYVSWLLENGALDKSENLLLKESFQEIGLLS